MFNDTQIKGLTTLVRDVGNATLRYFQQSNQKTELKADFSPVTEADRVADKMICEYLKTQFPLFPVISEEGASTPYQTRKNWNPFWLVDPLDGTKEFVSGSPDFTVNIALIENHTPILGLVGIPVTGEVFIGAVGKGAFKEDKAGTRKKIAVRKSNIKTPTFVISRTHGAGESETIKKHFPSATLMQVGSSLKFLKIAEGVADVYFRHQGISEWDTAAGHAVLLAAGGKAIDHTGKEISYSSESLKVNPFIAIADPTFPWKPLTK